MSKMPAAIVAVAVAALLAGQAVAQEAVTLDYDPPYAEGVVVQTEIESKTDQTLTIAGMPVETHGLTFMKLKDTIAGKSSEGGWTHKGEFTLVQSDLELPGGLKVSFNSNNPDAAKGAGQLDIIIDALKATAGAKWTAETNASHQIVKMEYEGDPFADVDPMVGGQSDPETVMKTSAIEVKRYPDKPVKPGDSWTRTEESALGGGQTLTLGKTYTYAGIEEHDGRMLDKVTSKATSVIYAMADDSPSPAKVTKSELKVDESSGTLWYDRQTHRYVDASDKVHITGSLAMEINGQKYPSELDLTITTSSKSTLEK